MLDAKNGSKASEPLPTADADLDGGVAYWAAQAASNDGVLGGYGHLSQIDALSSRMFLLTVLQRLSTISASSSKKRTSPAHPQTSTSGHASEATRPRTRALDVGSGIGRVSAAVLLPLVDEVHVVEPVEHLIKEAHRAASAGKWKALKPARADGQPKSCSFYQASLQTFDPQNPDLSMRIGLLGEEGVSSEPNYDVIWCQWCLGHLSDDQLVEWFQKCKLALRGEDSVIIVKENVTHPSIDREFDEGDKSWTRSSKVFKEIFARAGLRVVREDEQKGFPQELFAVWMYALR